MHVKIFHILLLVVKFFTPYRPQNRFELIENCHKCLENKDKLKISV